VKLTEDKSAWLVQQPDFSSVVIASRENLDFRRSTSRYSHNVPTFSTRCHSKGSEDTHHLTMKNERLNCVDNIKKDFLQDLRGDMARWSTAFNLIDNL
jgi:hypothetical protein